MGRPLSSNTKFRREANDMVPGGHIWTVSRDRPRWWCVHTHGSATNLRTNTCDELNILLKLHDFWIISCNGRNSLDLKALFLLENQGKINVEIWHKIRSACLNRSVDIHTSLCCQTRNFYYVRTNPSGIFIIQQAQTLMETEAKKSRYVYLKLRRYNQWKLYILWTLSFWR